MHVRTDTKAGAACYNVKSGDTLASIAENFYGSPATYNNVMKIYYSNLDTIGSNMNTLYSGQKLYIPD